MLASEASEDDVLEALKGFEGRIAVAAVNAPRAVVVSGDGDAIDEWAPRLEGRRTTRLGVSHAFHSHRVEPMLDEFRRVAEDLDFNAPAVPIVSNLTGEQVGDELMTADYWVRHVREAVRFADGVRFLEQAGVTRFLELGPDGVLSAMARQSLTDDEDALLVPTLRRRRLDSEAFVGFLAQAHVHGIAVDWRPLVGA